MSDKVTIQEMVALRERIERTDARIAKSGYGAMSEQEHADSVTAKLQFPAAVTAAERALKALAKLMLAIEIGDSDENALAKDKARALLDELYQDWRAKKP